MPTTSGALSVRRFLSACRFHAGVTLLAAGLAACSPVSVQELTLTGSYRERVSSALSGNTLSPATQIVLETMALKTLWAKDPDRALSTLREQTISVPADPSFADRLFALSELHYLRGKRTRNRVDYMAAAVYAWAFLAPGERGSGRPDVYDTRFRQACDFYILGLTAASGSPVSVAPQRWTLPFGMLDLYADVARPEWRGHPLKDFRPTVALKVHGLRNVYSRSGLGEPLAALPEVTRQDNISFGLAGQIRIPLSLLMVIPDPRKQILGSHLTGTLTLSAIDETTHRMIGDERVPLQYDQTAARAISLQQSVDWSAEYRGFLDGSLLLNEKAPRLLAIEPHQPGHMPVVLIHGTASGPARWADMVNDLLEDPDIRKYFEFWFFSYGTGNPIPYSALELRQALSQAVQQFGGPVKDPALGQITLIGHSQGGLLARMLTIDAGNRLWNAITSRSLDSLSTDEKNRELIREAMFPEAMPEVKRVVFISTPQHGSYLAGYSVAQFVSRFVTFPATVTSLLQQVVTGDAASSRTSFQPWHAGSVYGMSPNSPFIRSLAQIPVAPGIAAHSIIPVLGDGPLRTADDGVVKYESAHLPGVESELVVRHSGHSTQSNPVTIAEVRRILLEQIHTAGLSTGSDRAGQPTHVPVSVMEESARTAPRHD